MRKINERTVRAVSEEFLKMYIKKYHFNDEAYKVNRSQSEAVGKYQITLKFNGNSTISDEQVNDLLKSNQREKYSVLMGFQINIGLVIRKWLAEDGENYPKLIAQITEAIPSYSPLNNTIDFTVFATSVSEALQKVKYHPIEINHFN